MRKTILVMLAASTICVACSSIYVGNVKFSETEVCSEEYSSRIVSTGCLPPAPVANAQSYMFKRFRLPITESEQELIGKRIEKNPIENGQENMLPNILGRIFIADHKEGIVTVPEAGGQITFLSGELTHLPTELVKMDMTGAAKKKISAGTEVDMTALIEQAANAANLTKLSPETKSKLAASLSFSKQSTDISTGSYYYVSIEPQALANLVEALWKEGYMVGQAPKRETADGYGGGNGSYQESLNSKAEIPVITYSTADHSFRINTRCLGERDCEPKQSAFGVVIGAAVIHTKSGNSASCTRREFSALSAASGVSATCQELQKIVSGAVSSVVSSVAATELPNKEDAAKLPYFIQSLQFGYANTTLKTQDVGNHASLLAIKWLPMQKVSH